MLNGTKRWCSGGGHADAYVVYCRLSDDPGPKGIGAVYVEKGTPGLTFGAPEHLMGFRGVPSCDLFFDECSVPLENMILPAGGFRKLMEAIRQVLSMVLEQHAIELVLQQRQYGILVSPLHDHKLLGSAYFVLAASAQCDAETLRQRLPAHLKAGPVERIRQLVNLHLPGVRIKPLPVAPRQIPFHANKTYFVLELSPEEQAQLERSGGFAFHVTDEFPGLELKFWAIRN